MLRGLFDSPSHILLVVLVAVLLFGGRRLPDAARGLGRSLRIFKAEVNEMKNDSAEKLSESTEAVEGRIMDTPAAKKSTKDTAGSND